MIFGEFAMASISFINMHFKSKIGFGDSNAGDSVAHPEIVMDFSKSFCVLNLSLSLAFVKHVRIYVIWDVDTRTYHNNNEINK